MVKRISFRQDGIEKEWEELENHISGSRSDFLRECIRKQVNMSDDLTELKNELKERELQLKIDIQYIENIKNQINTIEENHRINAKNELLIEEKIMIAKKVYENEGLTKDRVIAIAKDEIDPILLINRLHEEGYDIGKKREMAKEFTEDNSGNKFAVKEYVKKEKTPFQTLFSSFKRNYKPKIHGDNPLIFLEQNKEKYRHMCNKYNNPNITYDSFREYMKKIYGIS